MIVAKLNPKTLLKNTMAAVLILGSVSLAQGQAYPSRPITLIIPQAPGGGSDTIGRYIADKLKDRLGQPIVTENRAGAAGMLGAAVVKRAPADGYTMLLGAIDTIVTPLVSRNPPIDGIKDFAPITQLATSHNVWLVGPGFQGNSLTDLVAAAKANPGKLDYASSGFGSMQHLAGAMLSAQAGIELSHVPYKGGPPAFADVIGGRVPVMVSGFQGALPQIRAGKVRGLAVTGKQRSPTLPDLPTVSEALGLPNYEALNWQGLFFPAGTPEPIVERIASEVRKIIAAPETQAWLVSNGYEPTGNTPAEFAALIAADHKRWAEIIKASNISSD
jgi:tripartite-type tricarboxylate transporter receptor subunit TctC